MLQLVVEASTTKPVLLILGEWSIDLSAEALIYELDIDLELLGQVRVSWVSCDIVCKSINTGQQAVRVISAIEVPDKLVVSAQICKLLAWKAYGALDVLNTGASDLCFAEIRRDPELIVEEDDVVSIVSIGLWVTLYYFLYCSQIFTIAR